MPKSAVVNLFFEEITEDMSFKKLALFFDDIYINERSFRMWKMDAEFPIGAEEKYKRYVQEVEWLINNGIVKTYLFDRHGKFNISGHDNNLVGDIAEVEKVIEENMIYDDDFKKSLEENNKGGSSKFQYVGALRATNDLIFNIEDIKLRVETLQLSLTNVITEFVPILKSFDTYKSGKVNDSVLHFVLDKIPTPDIDTPWEQLIDFRTDEDVKRKYYALINWVNEMSRSNMPISHVADKYNQLYSEYVKQYSLHKLNSNFTTMELLVIGGFEFISSLAHQNYISAFRNMLNIGKQQIALMKAEREIQGRELAYVYSVNDVLKK